MCVVRLRYGILICFIIARRMFINQQILTEATPVAAAAVPRRSISFASEFMASCRCGNRGELHWPVHANLNSSEPRAEVVDDDKMAVFAIAADNMAKVVSQGSRSAAPMTAGLLHRCLRTRTMWRTSSDFKGRVNSTGHSAQGFAVPDKVQYPRACGELCLTTSKPDRQRAYLATLHGFGKFAQRWTPAEVCALDILVMMQPFLADVAADVAPAVFFCFLVLSQGQYMGEPSQQTFIELQPCNDMLDVKAPHGTELEIMFNDFIQPMSVRSAPLQQQHVGTMRTYSEQELAAKFVDDTTIGAGTGQVCKLDKVIVRTLRFTDLSLQRVRVDGFADAEAFEISLIDQVKERKPKPGKSKRIDLCSDM